jgi:acyl-CoA thioester hydrolase
MQRADFRHFIELPVRWGDMDAFGHVNNVHSMRYLESGRIAYVEDVLGITLESKENIVLANIQCSFLQQLHYPATVAVATRINRLGRSSLHIRCAIYRQGESEPVVTGKGVLVWFDFISHQAIPLPDPLRAAILNFEIVPPDV